MEIWKYFIIYFFQCLLLLLFFKYVLISMDESADTPHRPEEGIRFFGAGVAGRGEMWVLGTKLESSGREERASYCWAVSSGRIV